MQIARLPKDNWSAASRIVTGRPRCARPSATAMPTGPAPTMTTGRVSSAGVIDAKSEAGYFLGW